jgi:hypothetical protein
MFLGIDPNLIGIEASTEIWTSIAIFMRLNCNDNVILFMKNSDAKKRRIFAKKERKELMKKEELVRLQY